MATISSDRLASLLQPFLPDERIPESLLSKLGLYLDLLMRWNGRTNLTAVREPEEMVTRHFGESLFAGLQLQARVPADASVLDYGSGAGFPGLPIQLLLPEIKVTLAESQGKKAAFLREAVRVLGLPTELWPRRVEDMPADRKFKVVTMRAVDNMDAAQAEGRGRLAEAGMLVILGGEALAKGYPEAEVIALPESTHRFVIISRT